MSNKLSNKTKRSKDNSRSRTKRKAVYRSLAKMKNKFYKTTFKSNKILFLKKTNKYNTTSKQPSSNNQ